jgi:hypothetical protein
MAIAATSLLFLAASAACAERLARARRPAWACVPAAALLGAWVLLWRLRLPPTPGHALLAFALADFAVLAIAVVAVLRLLGGFAPDASSRPDDPGDEGGDEPWVEPPPRGPHPAARATRRHPGGPRRPARRHSSSGGRSRRASTRSRA